MIPFKELDQNNIVVSSPEKLGFTENLLVHSLKLFPKLKISLKISYYQHFICFLEVIGLYIIYKNQLVAELEKGLQTDKGDRTRKVLFDLLFHYEIVVEEDGIWSFSKNYRQLTESDLRLIERTVEDTTDRQNNQTFLGEKLRSFQFICSLISYYRGENTDFSKIKNESLWKKLIDNKELDYEIRLAETLKQLQNLRLPNKIKSPFDDSYYTESGRNAFKNYTRKRFISCLEHISKTSHIRSVLDVGCGYGNYIGAVADWSAEAKITGIEMQEKVFAETSERFSQHPTVSLLNQNIFDFSSELKYDLILFNYVLFYFSNEQKEQLFQQLSELLSDNGSILICQYYSRIEPTKKQLLEKQNDNTLPKRIGMHLGNKILYANALWNETSDAFVQSEDWEEFETLLVKAGFEVTSITHADPFYYSLFVRATKKR